MPAQVPPELASTLALLRRAYPDGQLGDDLPACVAMLKAAGMSDRRVAEVIAALRGQASYVEALYEVAHLAPTAPTDPAAAARAEARLRAAGYEAWRAEPD